MKVDSPVGATIRLGVATALLLGFPLQQDPSRWAVAAKPVVSIGDNGSDTLIVRSLSAVRLSNGSIIVASNKTSQLQWFDASGRYVKTTGRRGGGPGEFAGAIYLQEGRNDSLVARDDRNKRYNYFAPNGLFVRVDSFGDRRRSIWVYDRTVVLRAPTNVDFDRLGKTLTGIPIAGRDSTRTARVDRSGNVWIASPTEPHVFTIYAPDSRRVGSIALPPRFDLYQILDTLVLGHWTDEDELERIQLLRITPGRALAVAPASTGRRNYDQAAELENGKAIVARMKTAMMLVMSAQEDYFANHIRYTATLADLPRAALPTEFKASLFNVERNSYSLMFTHGSTPVSCVMAFGSVSRLSELIVCG